MLDFSTARITRFAATWVGNKGRFEGVSIPKQTLMPLHAVAEEMLISTLLKPFEKNEEFHYFYHEEDVSNHFVYQSCMAMFQNPEEHMNDEVTKLAQQLYTCTDVPKVQGGEFFVAFIEGLHLQDEPTSALAFWKVQSHDPFLKTERTAESFALNIIEGIPTGKPEVIALVFNLDEAEGYRIATIDKVSKSDERSFWKDEFLRLRPIEDNYFNTRHYINLSSEFLAHKMPVKFGMDRADTIDKLNRSSDYFKDNESFEVEDFTKVLFPDEPEQQQAFMDFRDEYANAYAVPLNDQFDISNQAVKKEIKVFKSVIKLDKNFHLYVHGRRDLIERGFDDDKGKKYYKVYFDNEE
jgi:37-kD nucleoid-associated bacterial protein